MINELISHLIFASATIALMMACMQLLKGLKGVRSSMVFLFLIVTALQLYQFFIIYQYHDGTGFITQQFFGAPKFIVGPVLFIYFSHLFDRRYRFTPLTLFHFLPAVISLVHRVLFMGFYFPVDFGLSVEPQVFRTIAFVIDFSGFILLVVYLLLTFRKIRLLSVLGSVERTIGRLSLFILVYIVVVILLYVASVFYTSEEIVRASNILTSLGVLLLFVLSQKYPQLLDWFRREVKEKSYKNSLLKGIDLHLIKERLSDLMEEEKIYYDEELTPQKLAHRLSISQHQLSELLNRHMEMSFYNYVSHYRIEEVKSLLLENEHQSILSIAYGVGFNTKSSFYEAFSRSTGMTPLKYREEHLKSK